MAGRVTARTVLNRAALDEIHGHLVDGMAAVGQEFLDRTRPNVPDAPPYGVGLVETGAFGVWSDGQQVAGSASRPETDIPSAGILLVAGYDDPARFLEEGTVHNRAFPFVTPGMLDTLPSKDEILAREFKS